MKTLKKDEILAQLRDSPRWVTFKKLDGDTRVLHCTLQKSVVPKTDEDYNNLPGDSIVAWDLEKNAWRSFVLDRVTRIARNP